MKVEEEAILSYYKELEPINSHPNVMLVRHIEMQQIFVKKILPLHRNLFTGRCRHCLLPECLKFIM